MNFTKTPPADPGLYWYRCTGTDHLRITTIVKVFYPEHVRPMDNYEGPLYLEYFGRESLPREEFSLSDLSHNEEWGDLVGHEILEHIGLE